MRTTIIIGATLGLVLGLTGALSAQTLRSPTPPAEFPPASFQQRQYVDSRGCVYVRAGTAANITWIPRVARNRQQLCGYAPSLTQAQRAAPSAPRRTATAVEEIRIETAPAAAPAKPAAAPARAAAPQPAPAAPQRTATAAPSRILAPLRSSTRTPSPGPAPTVFKAPDPVVKPAPAPQPARVARPAPVVVAAPVVAVPQVAETTRVVRRHIHDNRQNTRNVSVPKGYAPVWEDDRLNPHRAERTLSAGVVRTQPMVPQGYRAAWGDDRLNPKRATGSAAGEAQTDQIWTRTLPRTLEREPTRGRIVTAPDGNRRGNSPFWQVPEPQSAPAVTRLSTRSAPAAAAPGKPRFVQVAAYAADASAQTTARALTRQGLPMRLGKLSRGGATYRVVLAGPFATEAQAGAALLRITAAGFVNARVLR